MKDFKNKMNSQKMSSSRPSSNDKKKLKNFNYNLYDDKNVKISPKINQDFKIHPNFQNLYKLKSDKFIPETHKKTMHHMKVSFNGHPRRRKTTNQSSSVKSEYISDNSNTFMNPEIYTNTDYDLKEKKLNNYHSPLSDELSNNFNQK